MTSIQATDLAAYEAKHAREQAVQQMQDAINHLQRTHYEMCPSSNGLRQMG